MASSALVLHPMVCNTRPIVFDALPEDLLFLIAHKLETATDLCSFEAVNKLCRVVSSDNVLWKRLCCDKFGAPSTAEPPSWKQLYRFNHEYLYGVIFSRRLHKVLDFPDGLRLLIPM